MGADTKADLKAEAKTTQPIHRGNSPALDLDLVRSFVTVAECGGITKAAERLHRTPGALSQQMKRLEQVLGKQLLIREPRQVRLTDDGGVLLGMSRQILKMNGDIFDRFLGPNLEGEVRLGLPDHLGTKVLPEALSRFAQSHSSVRVEVELGRSRDLAERFKDGHLDIVLTSTHFDLPAKSRVIISEDLVWAMRDGGIAQLQRPLPVSVSERGCAWRDAALESLDRAGIEYRIAYASDSCAGQEAAMLADLAIAPFPASLLKPPLKRIPESLGLPEIRTFDVMMYMQHEASKASEALGAHICELYPSSSLSYAQA